MTRKLQRSEFLGASGGILASSLARPVLGQTRSGRAQPVIQKITMLKVYGEFHRPVAMNAYDPGPKGKSRFSRLGRIVLSDGTTGVTVQGYEAFAPREELPASSDSSFTAITHPAFSTVAGNMDGPFLSN